MLCENTENELVIRYDGYDCYYTLSYDDFVENETLKLCPLEVDDLIGKNVVQTFKDKEGDTWDEHGIISNYNPATGLFYISYYETSELLKIYEGLHMLFEEIESDYINHEFKLYTLSKK